MENWTTVISFTYPHEAHVANSKLVSEGLETRITDELTVQVYNFYSNAIGGVKIQVKEKDVEEAIRLLKEGGFIQETEAIKSEFLLSIDSKTANIPFLGKVLIEIRIAILVLIAVIILIIPIIIFTLPNKSERLTSTTWYIDEMSLLTDDTSSSAFNNAFVASVNSYDRISFRNNGWVFLPGFNYTDVYASWSIKHNTLTISSCYLNTNERDSIIDKYNKEFNAMYAGTYKLKFKSHSLRLESDKLHIQAYDYYYRW